MVKAKLGDTVKVHYIGKLEDGTTFDSTISQKPLEFTIGEDEFLPCFEKAIIGMGLGEKKTETIKAEEAFGPYRDEIVQTIDRGQLPPGLEPEIGQQLQVSKENSQAITVTVIDKTETAVIIDANHPLAGEDLTFEIELIEIV